MSEEELYAQAAYRIETTPQLRPYRRIILESDIILHPDQYLWLSTASANDILCWASDIIATTEDVKNAVDVTGYPDAPW